jgi:hypothetical protein
MDGDVRYAAIREQIAAQHDMVRLERVARAAGAGDDGRTTTRGWSSGIATVIGTMHRHGSRKPVVSSRVEAAAIAVRSGLAD